jgi:hypothetical protein
MALSNWLTRDEWNACYFAGGDAYPNLGDRMQAGIAVLHKAGHKFAGIKSFEDGSYEKVSQCCGGNEAVLAEFMLGVFDKAGRFQELLAWKDGPVLDWAKLVQDGRQPYQPTAVLDGDRNLQPE